jgi:hypothetical protein
MQDYRLAEAPQMGEDFSAVFAGAEQPEILAVMGAQVNAIYPDSSSDTGYSFENLQFPATPIYIAATGSGNTITVYASGSDNSLYSLTYSAHPVTEKWKSIALPTAVNTVNGLKAGTVGPQGAPYVTMLGTQQGQKPNLFMYSGGSWEGGSVDILSLSRHGWCTVVAQNDAGGYYAYASFVGPNAAPSGNTQLFSAYFSAQGIACIPGTPPVTFSMLTSVGPNVFGLSPSILGQEAAQGAYFGSTKIPSSGTILAAIAAGANSANELELAALSIDGNLFHAQQTAAGAWTELTPAGAGGTYVAIQAVSDTSGVAHILALDGSGALNLIWQDPDTTDWMTEQIAFSAPKQIKPIASYRTVVTFYDQNEALAPATAVDVYCDQAMTMMINGETQTLNPAQPWSGNADASGCLTLSYQTSSLGVGAISVWSSFMDAGDRVAIDPSGSVQATLKALPPDGSVLLAANVLPANTPNLQAVAANLSQAIVQAMSLGDSTPPASAAKYLHRNCNRRVARTYALAGGLPPGEIDLADVPAQNWAVDFSSGSPVFSQLSEEQAAARREAVSKLSPAGGVFDWISDWGDVISSIAGGFVKLADFAIQTLANGIEASVTFVVDNVTYLFKTFIQWVRQAVDLVEGLFSAVSAGFESLFNWLGYLFNWTDILAMKDGISSVIQAGFGMAEGLLQYLETSLTGAISSFQADITTYFQTIADKLTGSVSQEQQTAPVLPFNFESANSTNIVLTSVVNNPPPDPPSSSMLAGNSAVLEALLDALKEAVKSYQEGGSNYEAFSNAISYFEKMADSMLTQPDVALMNGLAGIVTTFGALANAVLSTINTLISAILNALIAVIQQIESSFTAAWDIPFLSDLYAYITTTEQNPEGSQLSTCDLISLIVAIPFTVVYKIVAPDFALPDLTTYSASDILSSLGIGSTDRALQVQRDGGIEVPPVGITIAFWVLNMMMYFPYMITSAILDGSDPKAKLPSAFAEINMFCEFGLAAAGSPLWSVSQPSVLGIVTWAVSSSSTIFDAAMFLLSDQLPETFTKFEGPIFVTTAFGVSVLALIIADWATDPNAGEQAEVVAYTGAVIAAIPEVFKILRWQKISNHPRIGKAARIGLAVTDLGCYTLGDMLGFAGNLMGLPPGDDPGGPVIQPQVQTI